MNRLENYVQSYSQAPWRKQLQAIGVFSIVLVFTAIIAGIYLNVNARTAAVGRSIQSMRSDIEDLDREIEDLTAQIALVTSDSVMKERADQMGYKDVHIEEITYITVTGYIDRRPAILAPYTGLDLPSARVMPPEYTESIFEWLKRQFNRLTSIYLGLMP